LTAIPNSLTRTAGYFPSSQPSIFIFDITKPQPAQMQVIPVHASFVGLARTPSSDRLFVSGGIDDMVREFVQEGSTFVTAREIP
jgi:hypothetical protein